jgi:membrane associated rhomboid family serine protease
LNLLITFAIPGISIGGHVGGAITGAVVGYAMLEPRWTRTSPAIAWLAPLMAVMISVVVIGALL